MKDYNGFSPKQRVKALNWFKDQIARGNKPEQPDFCECCGQRKGKLMWHSEDYSEPFSLKHIGKHGLCYRCHMIIHCRHRNPQAFSAYAMALLAGKQFMPLHYADWETFKRDHLMHKSAGVNYHIISFTNDHLIDHIYRMEF